MSGVPKGKGTQLLWFMILERGRDYQTLNLKCITSPARTR